MTKKEIAKLQWERTIRIRRILLSLGLCLAVLAGGFMLIFATKLIGAGAQSRKPRFLDTEITQEPTDAETSLAAIRANADPDDGETRTDNGEEDPDKTGTPEGGSETAAEPKKKVICLTFDDGPGRYTERLLDILKAHNVKATFFVTNMYPEYADLLTREAKEGHTVAVHSYSHKYENIYASTEDYWKDFEKMQSLIEEKTGQKTTLFRFPGGSSNTISDFNPGVMTALTEQAEEKGYTWFDWNISSGDAGDTSQSETVVENCKEGVLTHNTCVILCHDVKEFTVDAMDEFITWALQNGYLFRPLTEESWPAHHDVLN